MTPDGATDRAEATLARWLQQSRRVMAFTGAGISAESGLPTFRGADGLWEGHRIEDVAVPEAFEGDPAMVWRFYSQRQAQLVQAEPNAAHRALASLEGRCEEFLLVTQNVDDLHERAGSRELIHLHGHLMRVRCVACGHSAPLDGPVPAAAIDAGSLPRCECGELLRPDVVWFGECLDASHIERIRRFLLQPLDLLLVVGTSGEVSGGYGLTAGAHRAGAKVVEINPHRSWLSEEADLAIRAPAAVSLARVMGALKC